MQRRVRGLWRAALLLAAGCSVGTGLTQSRATLKGMPCSEGERVARAALLRLGYDGGVVTPAQPGSPGTVVGHKAGGYDYVTNAATRRVHRDRHDHVLERRRDPRRGHRRAAARRR